MRAGLPPVGTAAPSLSALSIFKKLPADYMQSIDIAEKTIAELQALMEDGRLISLELVDLYVDRIVALDRHGPQLKSILEINPDARDIAVRLDKERQDNRVRGPLHGIPILLKDNIDTSDAMMTNAGSLALVGSRPSRDAFVARQLRRAGAVLLGKTNLSEWANFRSTHSSSGWSGRGGQARNPYALDRSPCGSSSGSASAVAANLAAASLGTETDGSILCPASANSVVGIKPTVGLTSRSGVIPIAHSQDTVGPFGRSVADAATLLSAIVGVDPHDPATVATAPRGRGDGRFSTDYTLFLEPDGLHGARIGVAREVYFGYSEKADAIVEDAIQTMKELGATVVDPANIPTAQEMRPSDSEREVLLYEFKADLNAYLAALGPDAPVHALQDIIDFNDRHADEELPYFGQEILHKAQEKGPLTDPAYLEALETNLRLSRREGIDAVMDEFQLDALVMPTTAPPFKIDLINGDRPLGGSSKPAAMAGYPAISVPAGYAFELPVGITFMGRAFSEPTLIRLAHAFEQATKVRTPPKFLSVT